MAGADFEMKEELYRLERLELDERLKQVIVLGEMFVAAGTDVPSDVQAFVDATPAERRTSTIETATRDVLAIKFRMSDPAMTTMRRLDRQRRKDAKRQAQAMRAAAAAWPPPPPPPLSQQ
ncbi:hypothetical protein PINS_up022327 [Pythium insidiosum]|nr:hypothetical protein PINS_up022327 [Pythium insidiosum]